MINSAHRLWGGNCWLSTPSSMKKDHLLACCEAGPGLWVTGSEPGVTTRAVTSLGPQRLVLGPESTEPCHGAAHSFERLNIWRIYKNTRVYKINTHAPTPHLGTCNNATSVLSTCASAFSMFTVPSTLQVWIIKTTWGRPLFSFPRWGNWGSEVNYVAQGGMLMSGRARIWTHIIVWLQNPCFWLPLLIF